MSSRFRGLMPGQNLIYDRFKKRAMASPNHMEIDRSVKEKSLVTLLNDRHERDEKVIDDLRNALFQAESDLAEFRDWSQRAFDVQNAELTQAQTELAQERSSALLVQEKYESIYKSLESMEQEISDLRETSKKNADLSKELESLQAYPEKLEESEMACRRLQDDAEKKELEIARLTKELRELRLLPAKLQESERENGQILERVKDVEKGYEFLEGELETLRAQRRERLDLHKSVEEKLAKITQRKDLLRKILVEVCMLFRCCVCIRVVKPPNPIRLDCGHMFCEDCFTQWFHQSRTCPYCRAVLGRKAPQPHLFPGYAAVSKLLRKHEEKLEKY